jgi:hypothetical protein
LSFICFALLGLLPSHTNMTSGQPGIGIILTLSFAWIGAIMKGARPLWIRVRSWWRPV